MFRPTGAGKIEVDPKYSSPGMLKALLYNFDFDDMKSTALKGEHSTFLLGQVVPLLQKDRGHIWMRGSASRVGDSTYNKTLSDRRVRRVATFLQGQGVADTQMQLEAVGEELTEGHAMDDERDRSVAFVVLPKAAKDPPPPPPVPPKPAVSDQFRVRMLGQAAFGLTLKHAKWLKGKLGAGPAADVIFFQIWDTTNNLAAIYLYLGGGAGAGFYWVSATHIGPWNQFSTSKPITSGQFGGFTRFTTGGAGPYTLNFLNMCGTPPGVDDVYLQINTGLTVGAGASTTVGDLILVEGPDPFTGP